MENPNFIVPTPPSSDSSNRAASTEFVTGAVASAEFPAGTVMLFQQTSAPTGWTKVTTFNDVGLRVVSGTAGSVTSGAAFSTVFAQTVTGGHALSTAELPPIPSGNLSGSDTAIISATAPSATHNVVGSGTAHTHPVTLNLNYVDIIIATKN